MAVGPRIAQHIIARPRRAARVEVATTPGDTVNLKVRSETFHALAVPDRRDHGTLATNGDPLADHHDPWTEAGWFDGSDPGARASRPHAGQGPALPAGGSPNAREVG